MSLSTLRAKKVIGGTITKGLRAAKKWAKGLTKKARGEGVEGGVFKGKNKEEKKEEKETEQGEEDEGEVVGGKAGQGKTKMNMATRVEGMTARGQLESYT